MKTNVFVWVINFGQTNMIIDLKLLNFVVSEKSNQKINLRNKIKSLFTFDFTFEKFL